MANFESKNVAITQAIREFIAKYAPEYYREAQKVQATAEVYTTYLKENPQLGDMAQEARYRVLEKLRKEKEGTS
jgi:putative hemolysin